MAQTTRATWTSPAPTTEFNGGADIIAQSAAGNYSTVRVSAQAINRGNASSVHGSNGSQTVAIDGISGSASRSGTIPSGVNNGVVRWDVSADLTVPHDAAGNASAVTIRQTIAVWFNNVSTGSLGSFPRIPKPSTAPGLPVASLVMPTTLRITWTAPTDNGGSAVTSYKVYQWDNPEGTGTPTVYTVAAPTLFKDITGLIPGKEYRFLVTAQNGSYGVNSPSSAAIVVRTLSSVWVKVTGHWKRAVIFVKTAGVWKVAAIYDKVLGHWKSAG